MLNRPVSVGSRRKLGMLSIVVSWRDREQLSDALPSLSETEEILEGEVIIVNFSSSDELLKA